MEKISIIIPFFNCPFVTNAIESAINQTHSNIEIILVDDGSFLHKDNLIEYKDKVTIITKKNGGTASALNAGLEAATGEYFCWLSSDDVFLPNKVALQLEYMKEEGACISSTNFRLINEKNEVTSATLGFDTTDYLSFLKVMRRGCVINGCTVMMKMDLIKSIGYFDEQLPHTQDYDLWLRVISSDKKFYHLNQPLTHYRVHKNMGSLIHQRTIKREVKHVSLKHRIAINQIIINHLQIK